MSLPLVSVVTPSLNQGRFIREALRSVLEQDYPRVESVVVDGGSRDDTHEVVAAFGDRVRFVSEPDDGQSDAINKGFRLARGEVLTWLNCDDRLEPGAIGRAVAAFRERPDAGLVYGSAGFIDEVGAPVGGHAPPLNWDVWELANVYDFVCQPASFFTREAIDRVGPLRADLHYAMDWDLFLRIGATLPIVRLPGPPLASLRLHPSTKTATGGWARLREIARLGRLHSGRRLPAATLLYGLEWLFEGARRRLLCVWPGLDPVSKPTSRDVLARTRRRLGELVVRSLPMRHVDNWAGPRLLVTMRPGGPGLRIRGEVPAFCPLATQDLTVRAGATVLHASHHGKGTFELEVPWGSTSACEIEVRAARWFVPMQAGFPGGDRRRLSWLVRSIAWV